MNKKILPAAGFLAAGLVAGSAFSISAAANAADENATPVASTNSVATDPSITSDLDTQTFDASDDDQDGDFDGDHDGDHDGMMGANSLKPGETLVTGDALQTLTEAALAKYPGATIIRVENDSDDATYEVHLKQADGGVVTVEFDANFAVTGTHNGFANGTDGGPSWDHMSGKGHGGGHGHHGANDSDDETDDDQGLAPTV